MLIHIAGILEKDKDLLQYIIKDFAYLYTNVKCIKV